LFGLDKILGVRTDGQMVATSLSAEKHAFLLALLQLPTVD